MGFDPATLSVLAIGSTLLGSGVSALGQMNSANYQAQVAKNNASIATQNATADIEAGLASQQQQALKTRSMLGQQAAAQGSNGLDVNSGSNVAVRSSTAALGELSGLTIRNNAARAAYGAEVTATSDIAQSQLDDMQGTNSAISTLIGGVSQGASLYGSMKRTGALPSGSGPDFP